MESNNSKSWIEQELYTINKKKKKETKIEGCSVIQYFCSLKPNYDF